MSTNAILLRSGTILAHNSDDSITPLYKHDLLIHNSLIKAIGRSGSLDVPSDARIIDCHNKIISPGLIDTHHHLWQSQLKGRFNDDTLLDYMPRGNMAAYAFSPADLYWGQLCGCLEAIDAGSTCVVDHAHGGGYSTEHATQAIAATVASGLRCIYCYTYILRLDKWDMENCIPNQDLMPEWATKQIEELAKDQAWGEGRVTLGFGFDFFFLPKEVVVGVFKRMRELGVQLITIHVSKNTIFGRASTAEMLRDYGLLGKDVLISHGSCLEEHEYGILKDAGIYISSTPDTEAQMGLDVPVCLEENVNGCLGVDCHVNNSSSILQQARAALLLKRAKHNGDLLKQGKFSKTLPGKAVEAFNLATIQGARACGMDAQIGSLETGKRADVVIIDAGSPNMVCAAEEDPVVAVLRFSDVRDVDTVIIDGIVRKEGGKLVDIDINGKKMAWNQIAEELRRSREKVQMTLDSLDAEKGKDLLIGMWHIDRNELV